MAAAAAVAGGPQLPQAAGGFSEVYGGTVPRNDDPGVDTSSQQVRDAWYALGSDRMVQLCDAAYSTGDFGYLSTALKANHEEMKKIMTDIGQRALMNREQPSANAAESFKMMQMMFKSNAMLLTSINRNAHVEKQMAEVDKRVNAVDMISHQIAQLATGISSGKPMGGGNRFNKPV